MILVCTSSISIHNSSFYFTLVSDTELDNIRSMDTTKSETTNDLDLSENINDDRRRSSRATTQKNYAKEEDDGSDDEEDLYENGRPPPRRMRYKKRRGSDDSFVDDDDYEKLARKRKIVKYGKTISRSSITDHLKKLVDEDDEQSGEKRSGMVYFVLLIINEEMVFILNSITITRWHASRYE